ncbi:MAG: PAC2 family protein [Candidatus Bathyarchaeia archaeon]
MNHEVRFRSSLMIMGLDGWVNAGEVSTMSISYLIRKLGAKEFGEIKPDGFYDYQISRPFASIETGVIRDYYKPRNIFYRCESEGLERVILLFKGIEPHMCWSKYVEEILKFSKESGIKCIYTLGGYITDSLYYRDHISGSTNNPERIEEFKRCRVELTNYRGPTSIYSEISWESKKDGIDTVSLWAATPASIRGPNPTAALNLLEALLCLTYLEVDLNEMRREARSFTAQIVKEVEEESKLKGLTGDWYSSESSWDV